MNMSDNTCSICFNECVNTSTLPCTHMFCLECIISWFNCNPTCPLCRQDPIYMKNILYEDREM